jgi:hypothetical protein
MAVNPFATHQLEGQAFNICLRNASSIFSTHGGGAAVASDNWKSDVEKRSSDNRRTGRSRRSGVDIRSEEEMRAIGERRAKADRRSGTDRRAPRPTHTIKAQP